MECYEIMKEIKLYKCQRCGKEWIPKGDKVPGHCPNPDCNSPYWQRPRKPKVPAL